MSPTPASVLPPYDPARLLSAPFPERVRLVCRTWASQVNPTPRVVMAMYFREPAREPTPIRSGTMAAALFLAAFFVLEMGTLPGTWLKLTEASTMLSVIQP